MILSERLFSPYQLADLLGVTAADIMGWVNKGWLPAQRHADGSLRIPEKALIKFLRDRGIQIESLLADTLRQEAKIASAPPVVQAAPAAPAPTAAQEPSPADQGDVLEAEIVEHSPAKPPATPADQDREGLFEPIRLEAKDFVAPAGDIETPCEIESIPFGDEATGQALSADDPPATTSVPSSSGTPLGGVEAAAPTPLPKGEVGSPRRGEGSCEPICVSPALPEKAGAAVTPDIDPEEAIAREIIEQAPSRRPGRAEEQEPLDPTDELLASSRGQADRVGGLDSAPRLDGPEGQILTAVIEDALRRGRTAIHFRLRGGELDLQTWQGGRRFAKPHFGQRLPAGMGAKIIGLLESLAGHAAGSHDLHVPHVVWPVDGRLVEWIIVSDTLPTGMEVVLMLAGG